MKRAASLPAIPADGRSPERAPVPAVFHARMGEVNALLAVAIFTLGSALAALGFSLWAWYFAMSTYGPAAVRRWTGPWLIAAPLLGAIGLACLLRVWRLARLWVDALPDGLRVHHGRRAEWIAWTEVREIRTWPARPPGPAFSRLELRLDTKRRLRFTRSLADLESLVQIVKRNAYPLLQESCRARFNRGEELDFGPLRLTAEGVRAGKKSIQWGQVRSVEVRGGQLDVSADAPAATRIRVAAARVPNIDVCVQILRLLGQVP